MLNIYAQTFMTASGQRRCTQVKVKSRRWWKPDIRTCIDLSRL